MRNRKELFQILVDELNFEPREADKIIDKAFESYVADTNKRNEKINKLKESYLGKLLVFEDPINFPQYIYVNDIEESSISGRIDFIGPVIEIGETFNDLTNEDAETSYISIKECDIAKYVKVVADNKDGVKDIIENELKKNNKKIVSIFLHGCYGNVRKSLTNK